MIKIKVNRIIKYLLLSDLIFWTGWGLIAPILAVYVVDQIQGGSVFVVGAATSIYWILSSLLRIPFGLYLDSRNNEKLNYTFTIIGLLSASVISFGFIFARLPWHIYVIQALHAIAMSMNFSGWSALFTNHIDKGREATEWGISATSVGLGTGISGFIGGWAVEKYGFAPIFISVGILGILGSLLLLFISREMEKTGGRGLYFSFKELIQKGVETNK